MSPAADAGKTPAMITALFSRAADTERAYRATMALGYATTEIDLVLSEETRQQHFTLGEVSAGLARKAKESTEHKPPDATELGGPAGATAGTIAPAAAAVGTALLLPGLILAGPIAVALAAAGAVGVAGGLAGALTNWGIPKGRVEAYEKQIREGGILMGVKPKSAEDATELAIQWESAGGVMVKERE
jgi:hypothetical protein